MFPVLTCLIITNRIAIFISFPPPKSLIKIPWISQNSPKRGYKYPTLIFWHKNAQLAGNKEGSMINVMMNIHYALSISMPYE